MYLFINEHQKGRHRENPWLFYFGLIGASYREDHVSAILKQFSTYKFLIGEKFVRAPFCYEECILKYVQEIGWTGRKLEKLLESSEIVVNSTLHVYNFHDSLLDSVTYIIKHTTSIHKLRIVIPTGVH